MSRRPRLSELRALILDELDDDWSATSHYLDWLGLPARDWYRVALVLERLVNDGEAEIEVDGRRRYFRRAR